MTSDWAPAHWDMETDVVVVGAGNLGLPAAIEAHDAGARVLLLENNEFMGGLMRASGGFSFFCETHIQKNLGIEDHVEWGIEDEMLMSDFRAVPEIVRAYVEGGAETVLWLERLGLTWAEQLTDGDWGAGRLGTRRVMRTHFAGVSPTRYYPGGAPEGQNGFALTTVLEKAVLKRGIPVLFKHRMRKVYREPGGPVVGVMVETPTGIVNIRAHKAVVLAAGGATTNEALVRAWDPRLVGDAMYSDGLPYMTAMGDAIIAGEDVGGGLSDMSFVCFTPVKYGSHYYSLSLSAVEGEEGIQTTGVPIPARQGAYQRVILVKNDGTRYINEAEANVRNPSIPRDVGGMPPAEYPEEPFIRKFLSLPNPRNVWVVTDAEQAAELKWPINEIANPEPMRGRGLHPDSVAIANTLQELADKIHVHKANFVDTVQRYNGFAATGVDEEFGKAEPIYPIAKGPFYALKLNIIRHTPPGGLRINTKGQVLDRSALWDGVVAQGIDEEPVIPHLYAGGEAAAFVGWRRAHRKTGPILTMGRLTGIAAAREPLI